MKTQVFDVKMGKSMKIMTSVMLIAFIAVWLLLIIVGVIAGIMYFYSFITLSVIVLSYIYMPQKITLDEQCFTLYRAVGRLRFNYKDIERIEPCTINMLKTLRLFGIGGFASYTGVFSNAELGRFRAYIGDSKQTFLVVMKNGKKYVFSCADRDKAMEIIKEQSCKMNDV